MFDAATSIVPANKLILARRLGVKLLPGWVADEDGTPVMHEVDAPPPGPDGIPLANLLPLGSTVDLGSHKGYGLMAIVDILGGILSGGGYGLVPGRPNFNHYVAAYDIEAFMDTAEFKRTMDEWLFTLRTTRPALGHDRVVYAGLREAESVEDRRGQRDSTPHRGHRVVPIYLLQYGHPVQPGLSGGELHERVGHHPHGHLDETRHVGVQRAPSAKSPTPPRLEP